MIEVSSVINYFLNDPMKILYLLGGSGGLHYWINQWRSRARLSVKILSERYSSGSEPFNVQISIECINLGSLVTALNSEVEVKALSPEKNKRIFTLNVTESERKLAPHEPKILNLTGELGAVYPFTWYRRFRFTATRGRPLNIYTLNASNRKISFVGYVLGKLKLILFNKVPKS